MDENARILENLIMLLLISTTNDVRISMEVGHDAHFIKSNNEVTHDFTKCLSALFAQANIDRTEIVILSIDKTVPLILLSNVDVCSITCSCLWHL